MSEENKDIRFIFHAFVHDTNKIYPVININYQQQIVSCIYENNVKDYPFSNVDLLLSTRCNDNNEKEIIEGTVVRSLYSNTKMLICFGEYTAYCPVDEQWMTNIGFYALDENGNEMPLGPINDWAEVLGHSLVDKSFHQTNIPGEI
ncbi:hypothetical protein KHQ81_15640 (plasmid) [Mycoplasmatota bacterium]|nr:hypothetical protein KHQ81_15640 [Mycoplasmatota bacterium]